MPMEGITCRKCGKVGSVHLKSIKNGHGGTFNYFYMAHATDPHRVRWCYLGKKTPTPDSPTQDGNQGRRRRSEK